MIDIHSHVLYGIDDGPEDIQSSIALLRCAAADNIKSILVTSHFCRDIDLLMSARLKELQPTAAECGIRLFPGCEYDLAQLEVGKPHITLNYTSFMLVDLNMPYLPSFIDKLMFDFGLRGYKFILVHPERLLSVKDLPKLQELHRKGMFFQLNASSILGRSGRRVSEFAKKIIAAGLCHYIASDAHNATSRPFALTCARAVVAAEFGADAAEMFFEANPQALLLDKEPESIAFKRKTFLSRFWSHVRR